MCSHEVQQEAIAELRRQRADLLAALDAARAGTLGRQARIAELEAENTDLREGLGRLRAALEGAEEFFERVTGWDGPPNEREKVLDALRAALAPEEAVMATPPEPLSKEQMKLLVDAFVGAYLLAPRVARWWQTRNWSC